MENFEKIKRRNYKTRFRQMKYYKNFLPRCRGKHSYRTWEQAEKIRSRQEERMGYSLYTYECQNFDYVEVVHWHLTSKPRRK